MHAAEWQNCIFGVGGLESIPRELCWEHTVWGHLGSITVACVCVCVCCRPKHPLCVNTPPLGRFAVLADVIHTDWGWPWELGQMKRPWYTYISQNTLLTLIITITVVAITLSLYSWYIVWPLPYVPPFRSTWQWTTSEQLLVQEKARLPSQSVPVLQSQLAACKSCTTLSRLLYILFYRFNPLFH